MNEPKIEIIYNVGGVTLKNAEENLTPKVKEDEEKRIKKMEN